MAQWQRAGLDKSVAHANAPCGGVAVAGSSMTMRRQETSRWRSEARAGHRAVEKGGPDAWATSRPCSDPLLAPRRDGVEFVGGSGKTNGWDASTLAKSERDGDGVWMTKALGFRREVGHVATSGLADVPETSRGKVSRFLQKPHPNSVSAVFPKLPL